MVKLDEVKKAAVFKMLAYKPLYETGIEFGLDKHYKDVKGVKNAVYRIYNEVRQNPEVFTIEPQTVELVVTAVSERSVSRVQPSLRETNETINKDDIKSLVVGGRNKALKLVHSKMDRIGKSRKKLDAVSVGELAKVAGILFDKAQIIQGEATEHVAVLAKIDKNLLPEDALSLVLKMRETNQESLQK